MRRAAAALLCVSSRGSYGVAAARHHSGGLAEFVRSGPLLKQGAAIDEDRWRRLGDLVAGSLGLSPESESTRTRLYWLYLPIYEWIRKIVDDRKSRRPVLVAMHCPQGGGKTTMCGAFRELFEAENRKCVVMSIDDFYYAHDDLERLAEKHPQNALLRGRGNPGTHDVGLLISVLDALLRGDAPVKIPRYDKTARSGLGDRKPEDEWPTVDGRPDVVILEGWCLGFRAREKLAANTTTEDLTEVDRYLAAGLESIYDMFDAWLVFCVEDLDVVYAWREQAEKNARDQGKGAMTADQVKAFVDRYMPVYHQYTPALYSADLTSPSIAKSPAPHLLQVTIDTNRLPTLSRTLSPDGT